MKAKAALVRLAMPLVAIVDQMPLMVTPSMLSVSSKDRPRT